MMGETLINREVLPFAHGGVQNFGNRWIVSTTDRVETPRVAVDRCCLNLPKFLAKKMCVRDFLDRKSILQLIIFAVSICFCMILITTSLILPMAIRL